MLKKSRKEKKREMLKKEYTSTKRCRIRTLQDFKTDIFYTNTVLFDKFLQLLFD